MVLNNYDMNESLKLCKNCYWYYTGILFKAKNSGFCLFRISNNMVNNSIEILQVKTLPTNTCEHFKIKSKEIIWQ